MARTRLRDAFAHFGARARNHVWGWSACSADGKTVVVTFWKDHLSDLKQRPVVYDIYGKDVHLWTKKHGNRDRINKLKWARDHCNGRFRVVITVVRDEQEYPRKIRDCYPEPNLVMNLTCLDEETGEFRAESVSG